MIFFYQVITTCIKHPFSSFFLGQIELVKKFVLITFRLIKKILILSFYVDNLAWRAQSISLKRIKIFRFPIKFFLLNKTPFMLKFLLYIKQHVLRLESTKISTRKKNVNSFKDEFHNSEDVEALMLACGLKKTVNWYWQSSDV